ncbi:MAG: hypothetical protein JRF33_00365 [Deltaproteobacteria bacterium]|nr:hypothetical protein [Deltaproteobacteria bacterium]
MSERKNEQDGLEFLRTFKRGVEFTEELMAENVRLRERLMDLEAQLASKDNEQADSRESQSQRESMELENADFHRRHGEIDAEYDRLAKLYVTSYQLHSSQNVNQVMAIVSEVLTNLVGAKSFAFYVKKGTKLVPLQATGCEAEHLDSYNEQHAIAKALEAGELWLDDGHGHQGTAAVPLVAIPLRIGRAGLGMFSVLSLFEQKECVTELDQELFRLLGTHASTALSAALLYAAVGDESELVERLIDQIGLALGGDGKTS